MAPTRRMIAASLGKMPTTSVPALDLTVEALQRIGRMQLGAVCGREAHICGRGAGGGRHAHPIIVSWRRQRPHWSRGHQLVCVISSQQPSEIASSIDDGDQFDRIIRRIVLIEKKIVAFH